MRTAPPLVAIALLLASCDPMWKLEADVRVDTALQASLAGPHDVLVGFQREDFWEVSRAGVACPDAPAFENVVEFYALGCGPRGQVTAWIAPADPTAAAPCGPVRSPERGPSGPTPPDASVPQASADVFSSGCRYHDAANLVIAP